MANPTTDRIIIINHESRLHCVGGSMPITLRPGANEVDLAAWQQAKQIPLIVDHYLPEKKLEEVADSTGPKPLRALKEVETAVRIVGQTFDIDQLGTWASSENRPPVVEAIRDRRDTLRRAIEAQTTKPTSKPQPAAG